MNRTALLIMGIAAAIPVAILVGRPHPPAKPIVSAERAPLSPARRAPSPAPSALVYVVGAVLHPGLYSVAGQGRVEAAVRAAGGPSAEADLAALNLAEHLKDGEMVVVPKIGDARPARSRRPHPPATRPQRKAPPAASIDLNTAKASELAQLPGIGLALAERIVRFRELNGPFQSLDELGDVAGLNPHRIDLLAAYLTIR